MEERALLAWTRTVIAVLAIGEAITPRGDRTFDALVGSAALVIAIVLSCADDYPYGRVATEHERRRAVFTGVQHSCAV